MESLGFGGTIQMSSYRVLETMCSLYGMYLQISTIIRINVYWNADKPGVVGNL